MEENQTQAQTNNSQEMVTKPIEPSSSGNKLAKIVPVLLIVVVVVIGVATGFVLSTINKPSADAANVISEDDQIEPKIQENLSQTFSDEAQGMLEKNTELDKYAQGPWI